MISSLLNLLIFGVFADVSLHQWARLKSIKSSFQSNPGLTVLGGFLTIRLSYSSHDHVLPGTPGPLSVSLTSVLPRPSNVKSG